MRTDRVLEFILAFVVAVASMALLVDASLPLGVAVAGIASMLGVVAPKAPTPTVMHDQGPPARRKGLLGSPR